MNDFPMAQIRQLDLRGLAFAKLRDYVVLTKPEVNVLVLVAALAGFDLARRGPLDIPLLLNTLIGTLLVASGTGTLNQYLERVSDRSMRRTARRPLPAGRLHPAEALIFGLFASASGVILLWLEVNLLASILALTALSSYLLIYTPLKKKTALCTLIGAFPGAMPCLIGWAAARGSLDQESLVLFSMLFLWQFPHLLAIAWMYREDYSRAGLRMLPPRDPDGRMISLQIIVFLAVLVLVSMVPTLIGQAGKIYLLGALALGSYFLFHGVRLAGSRTNMLARRVVMASIIYLPLILSLLMLDRASITSVRPTPY
ncbi:MAG TPA: heme o synthase [Terriglobia bacterium]|nr:heme o synthase [Terriglobia bacterium]